jgi:hypothetical protein
MEIITLSEISSEKYHIFTHLWNLDLKKKYNHKRGLLWKFNKWEEGERNSDGSEHYRSTLYI